MKTLNDLITEAEKQDLWLHCSYQDLWFSPTELREANKLGQFRWGPVNWTLRDPVERVEALRTKVIRSELDLMAFNRRLSHGDASDTVKTSTEKD